MAESQHNSFDWSVEEDFSYDINNPKYSSDFPGLDFEASSDLNFATSLEPDAPLDSTATAPQEVQSSPGDVDFDAFLNMSQFGEQEIRIPETPKPVPGVMTAQDQPEKADSELEESEIDLKIKRIDLQAKIRAVRKLAQQEQQAEQIGEVENELERVQITLERIERDELLKRRQLIQKPRAPHENQRPNDPGAQIDSFHHSYSGSTVTTAINDNNYMGLPYSAGIAQGGLDFMDQRHDQQFASMDAHAVESSPSSVYRDFSTSHEDHPSYPPNLSSNPRPTIPPSGIVGNQYGVQHLPPALELFQQPAQPESQMVSYRQPSNPTQNDLSSSPFQDDSPGQNMMTGKRTRKRQRSPSSIEAQQLSAFRQQSRKKGVPGSSLGVLCFTAPKSDRTSAQKKNKREVEEDGGSCFLCRINKKQCSGQRPCHPCKKLYEETYRKWSAESGQSRRFMWTCTFTTRLADIELFASPSDETVLAQRLRHFHREDYGSAASMLENAHLYELMDFLEPRHAIECVWGHSPHVPYLRRFFFWREVLLYLAPELQSYLAFQELEYKCLFRVLLKICDLGYKSEKEVITTANFMLLSLEIPCLKTAWNFVASSAGQLESVLQSRFQILCGILFKANVAKSPSLHSLGMLINETKGFSSYLPPGDWSCPGRHLKNKHVDTAPHATSASRSVPACLLNRLESSKQGCNASPSGVCYCGWVVDSIPSLILGFFGHSPESLMRFVHGLEKDTPLSATLRHQMRYDLLPEILPMFPEVLQFMLIYTFGLIQVDIDGDYYKQCEDQHGGISKGYRQLLLVFVVQEAIFTGLDFLVAKHDQDAAKSIDGPSLTFVSWLQRSDERFGLLLESLAQILYWLHDMRQDMGDVKSWDDDSLEALGISIRAYKIERGEMPGAVTYESQNYPVIHGYSFQEKAS